jgi:hypothetical protein
VAAIGLEARIGALAPLVPQSGGSLSRHHSALTPYNIPPYGRRVLPYVPHHSRSSKARRKGQMEVVERALEAERPCGDVLQLLASIRPAP